ncbi:MAG: hypothetical protein HYX75_03315 [Acidobacteria bacterium]|nr:hypothetical protein [Acidobacteriota bacterium]
MVANGRILLARTHPFMVDVVRPFLTANGWSPEALADLADLARIGTRGYAGSIISTAPHGSVRQTYLQVFEALRGRYPNLPVAFTTLVDWDSIEHALRLQLSVSMAKPEILPVLAGTLASPALGSPTGILVIRKEDLTDPSAAGLTAQILRRHFAPKGRSHR